MIIRVCDPDMDLPILLNLWGQSLGPDWPLSAGWLRAMALHAEAYIPGDHLLAEESGQALGFVLTRVTAGQNRMGSLLALGVHPDHRRRGIGRALHAAALARLRERGAARIQLGAGAGAYFWPGVPLDLPGGWDFFQAMSWPRVESSFDLVRGLEDYATPAWVWERVRGLEFRTAAPEDTAAVLAVVKKEFPAWVEYYARAFQQGRSEEVLFALDGAEILGTCLVESGEERWAQRFERRLGAPGCILTAEAARECGIGMALTARANELLRERGCRTSFIDWTRLTDWYGKLGYRVWQEYAMSWRTVLL